MYIDPIFYKCRKCGEEKSNRVLDRSNRNTMLIHCYPCDHTTIHDRNEIPHTGGTGWMPIGTLNPVQSNEL